MKGKNLSLYKLIKTILFLSIIPFLTISYGIYLVFKQNDLKLNNQGYSEINIDSLEYHNTVFRNLSKKLSTAKQRDKNTIESILKEFYEENERFFETGVIELIEDPVIENQEDSVNVIGLINQIEEKLLLEPDLYSEIYFKDQNQLKSILEKPPGTVESAEIFIENFVKAGPGYDFYTQIRDTRSHKGWILIIIGLLFLLLIVFPFLAVKYLREHYREKDFGTENETLLRNHINNIFEKTSVSFYLAVVISFIGFVLISFGIFQIIGNTDGELDVKSGALTAGAGILIQFIGSTFLLFYKSLLEQSTILVEILDREITLNNTVKEIKRLESEKEISTEELINYRIKLLSSAYGTKKL